MARPAAFPLCCDGIIRPCKICGGAGGHLQTTAGRDRRDPATKCLKEDEPIFVTRYGELLDCSYRLLVTPFFSRQRKICPPPEPVGLELR